MKSSLKSVPPGGVDGALPWPVGADGALPWFVPLTPRCARLPVLLELVSAGNEGSSGSSGVGSGEGKWTLVRSGREPPVLWVAGIRAVVFSWSADGKMLGKAT